MDFEREFIASILTPDRDGNPPKAGYAKALERGITEQHFITQDGQQLWKFVQDYLSKYGKLPAVDTLFQETAIILGGADEPPLYYADKLVDRRLLQVLNAVVPGEVFGLLQQEKPREALERLEKLLVELRSERLGAVRVESLLKLGDKVLEMYEQAKAGILGIPFPWPSMTNATLGLYPGDMALLVARLGVGKTTAAILLAMHAWQEGFRPVLVVTTEMAREKIAQRFYAFRTHLPAERLRSGTLTDEEEKILKTTVLELRDLPGLYVVGGEFDFQFESLEAAIDEVRPIYLVLDGAYLMKTKGGTRTERASEAYDEVKRLLSRRQIAGAITTQFNREAKINSPKSASVEHIALSDVAGWNASIVAALIQTDDMKKDGRMIVKGLKNREGKSFEFECNWDFDSGNFAELADDSAQYGGGSSGSPSMKTDDLPF